MSKFNVGDKVRVVNWTEVWNGSEGVIVPTTDGSDYIRVEVTKPNPNLDPVFYRVGDIAGWNEAQLELIEDVDGYEAQHLTADAITVAAEFFGVDSKTIWLILNLAELLDDYKKGE